MHYTKHKRAKKSTCNICGQEKELSWDHVPPKGGIDITPVEMRSIFSLMTENHNMSGYESQNGMKYRTICKECNAYLGTEYDPTLNQFAISVGCYLRSQLVLPEIITQEVKPQRLMKALLGHLLAAKVNIENTEFDRQARYYILNPDSRLPDEIHVFYWVYPFATSVAIRDFAMFAPRGTFDEPAIFQTLKYFPIAYLCCDKSEYAGLPLLSQYRSVGLDDQYNIRINLRRVEESDWPEAPSNKENNVFVGGKSAFNAIQARPKKPRA